MDNKPVLTSVKKPQHKALVKRLHQVILNILVTRYIDNKVCGHIYPWGETLAYIGLVIRASYQRTITTTPGQSIFVRDMFFNLVSVVDWKVVTTVKQFQVEIDNVQENSGQSRMTTR